MTSDRQSAALLSGAVDLGDLVGHVDSDSQGVIATDAHDLTFKLIGTEQPPGQLGLSDLADICRALQELNTRVSRWVAGQHRGRTGEAAARIAQLRFTGIREGSTVLDVGYGEANVLPDPDMSAAEDETSDRFWEVITGISTGYRPKWTPEGVAKSALDLGNALAGSARTVLIGRADEQRIRFEAQYFARLPWQLGSRTVTEETVAVVGALRRVDLDSHRFMIKDDAGNSIAVEDVQNQDAAATLIGGRAIASGLAVRGKAGELKAVTGATVTASVIPDEWRPGGRVDKTYPSQSPGQPDWDQGILGLTDDESDRFLAAINGM